MALQGTNFEAPPSYPGSFVEGEMNVPSAAAARPTFNDNMNTLDEPIKDTIVRVVITAMELLTSDVCFVCFVLVQRSESHWTEIFPRVDTSQKPETAT